MFRLVSFTATLLMILPHAIPAEAAQQSPKSRAYYCKESKAGALIPIIRVMLQFKSDGAKFEGRISKLNSDTLCDCYYNGLEAAYGATYVVDMGQYDHADKIPPERLNAEDKKKDEVLAGCFGRQIGRPWFSPPSVEETQRAIAKAVNLRKAQLALDPADGNPKKANVTRFHRVRNSIQLYFIDNKKLPATLGELVTRKLLSQKDLQDIWGRDFLLKGGSDGKFELQSLGADGKFGTADDLFDP